MSSAQENPALAGRVLPTFVYYALPSLVGLIALTTSSLVDGIFVGTYVGGEALAAITLLLPVFTLLFAVALMFAIGGSVAAGKHIGANEEAAASEVFSQTLMAAAAVATLLALLSVPLEHALYEALSVPVSLEPMVGDYFGVIRWVLILQLTTMVLYYFVRADGHPVLATSALVTGALVNIGLDAAFVIGLEMGLRGAAYALFIAQVLQCSVLSAYFFSKSRTLFFMPLQRNWSRLVSACYNGVSEFINEISAGIIFWLLNRLLVARLGVEGVAAFSIVSYFVFLSLMLSYGVADALHLLVSQNLGARNEERISAFSKAALFCSLTIGLLLTMLLLVGRTTVTGWFLDPDDNEIAEAAAQMVLIVWPLFLINGTNVIASCYLTAIHEPRPSAIVATLRGLALPAVFLVVLFGLSDRWPLSVLSGWSFLAALPLAEWCTFAVAVVLCSRHRPASLGLHVKMRAEPS